MSRLSELRDPGLKEISDLNLRDLANKFAELVQEQVGGKLWCEVTGFVKAPRHGGGLPQEQWSVTINIKDLEILGRSKEPGPFDDIDPAVRLDK